MEFYDKLVDRFQDLLRAFKTKCFGEYDAVKLTMFCLKALHDMFS